jgi:hypothetical protein
MKFDELYNRDLKNNSFTAPLNADGFKLLTEYNEFIDKLIEITEPWIDNQTILNALSVISSEKKGTQKFKDARTLSTLSSDGKNEIDISIGFNKNDPIRNYIDLPKNI